MKSLFRRTAEVFLYSCMMYLTVLAAQVPPTLLWYQWYLGTVFYVIVNLPTLMTYALHVVHDQQRWCHWGGVPIFFLELTNWSKNELISWSVGQYVSIYITFYPFFPNLMVENDKKNWITFYFQIGYILSIIE